MNGVNAPFIVLLEPNVGFERVLQIGFLSFGHWTASAQSAARSARDVLLQSAAHVP
jgi:hypothetical protein